MRAHDALGYQPKQAGAHRSYLQVVGENGLPRHKTKAESCVYVHEPIQERWAIPKHQQYGIKHCATTAKIFTIPFITRGDSQAWPLPNCGSSLSSLSSAMFFPLKVRVPRVRLDVLLQRLRGEHTWTFTCW